MVGRRKRTWEEESVSLGDLLGLSRRMLSFAKGARDLVEATGVPRPALRDLATILLDIEESVREETGVDLTRKIQEYLATLIPQTFEETPLGKGISEVDRRIAEINAPLVHLYGAGWFRNSEKMGMIVRVWEELVAAGYNLPRDQFVRGSEYWQLIDDFGDRLAQLQPTVESGEALASMVEPMVDRAKDLVQVQGRAALPDTGFSKQVRGYPNYVRTRLEAVANGRPRYRWQHPNMRSHHHSRALFRGSCD